jgi:PAS domain S-box-containing protein
LEQDSAFIRRHTDMDRPPPDILRDSAIAAHASSARPAWLFASDGSRLIFANAAGAALLGLAHRRDAIGFQVPQDLAARIARSAETLRPDGTPRLERLRGLGTSLGQPLTCTCAYLQREAGPAILVAATETAGPVPALAERARYLIDDGIEGHRAVAAFGLDGSLLHATADAMRLIDRTASLRDIDDPGHGIETLKIGNGADAIVLALFPANSQPITGEPTGASVTAQQALLDLSPIAEAITAMTRVPPQRFVPPDDRRPSAERRHPLRFVWETDAENRFTISGDEFLALAGSRTSKLLGRFWGEISAKLALDPDGLVANALVSRATWSSIELVWPTANDATVPVTLSAIPVFDRAHIFRGYRGLGVWQGATPADEVDPVEATISEPQQTEPEPPATVAALIEAAPAPATDTQSAIEAAQQRHDTPAQSNDDTFDLNAAFDRDTIVPHEDDAVTLQAPQTTDDAHADANEDDAIMAPDLSSHPENVVPFPAAFSDPKTSGLNSAERSAFRDLASRLSMRLKGADELARGLVEKGDPRDDVPYVPPLPAAALQAPAHVQTDALPELLPEDDDFALQRPVLEQLPLGVLIYRGSNLLYANAAFLKLAGHDSLTGFAEAGGLDSLLVELNGADDDGRQRLRIAAADDRPAMEGRLVTASLGGEATMVLMLQPTEPAPQVASDATEAAELAALLDLASDGVVTLDDDAQIVTATGRAESLFGYDAGALADKPFGELLAPESERIARSRLDRLVSGEAISDDDRGEIIGRRRQGGLISLQLTLGRANSAGTRFHALFRDMTRWKEAQNDMTLARQQAEKASAAKSEFLAKISHEMRTPLNAIIGFSEMMMEERFGPLGNERYRDYLKDINASGAHVVSLLNDLLDLSKIEAGKMELSFERVDLNEVTQQSVAIMQTQASRARVIVRTALSMNIPGIVADTRSIRQIVLNLLSNSIKFTGAGGQVIVSTAANDDGHVTLRVRDTGIGMSEKDIETALQPFRQIATSSRTDASGTGLGLPLTKALVEANRARFEIKSAVNAGTLVEIAFPAARALAQ